MGVEPISGKVRLDGFRWRKHSGMQAKWQPVLRAKLTARPGGGTAIVGKIAPKLWMTILLTIGLPLIFAPAIYIATSFAMSDGYPVSAMVKLFALSIFPAAILAIFAFLARRTWVSESAFLLDLLTSTLEINPETEGALPKAQRPARNFESRA